MRRGRESWDCSDWRKLRVILSKCRNSQQKGVKRLSQTLRQLKYSKFYLDTKKPLLFPVRVVRHWNRWFRKVVESPSVEILKSSPYIVLGNLL